MRRTRCRSSWSRDGRTRGGSRRSSGLSSAWPAAPKSAASSRSARWSRCFAREETGAAVRLEELWNELARTTSFSLFCAYPISTFDDAAHAKAFGEISLAHSAVIPAESYATATPDAQSRVIVALQQKAEALENEMRQRAALEASLRSTIE